MTVLQGRDSHPVPALQHSNPVPALQHSNPVPALQHSHPVPALQHSHPVPAQPLAQVEHPEYHKVQAVPSSVKTPAVDNQGDEPDEWGQIELPSTAASHSSDKTWKYLIGIFLSLGRFGQTLQVRMGTMMAAVLLMIMILPILTGNITGLT